MASSERKGAATPELQDEEIDANAKARSTATAEQSSISDGAPDIGLQPETDEIRQLEGELQAIELSIKSENDGDKKPRPFI